MFMCNALKNLKIIQQILTLYRPMRPWSPENLCVWYRLVRPCSPELCIIHLFVRSNGSLIENEILKIPAEAGNNLFYIRCFLVVLALAVHFLPFF